MNDDGTLALPSWLVRRWSQWLTRAACSPHMKMPGIPFGLTRISLPASVRVLLQLSAAHVGSAVGVSIHSRLVPSNPGTGLSQSVSGYQCSERPSPFSQMYRSGPEQLAQRRTKRARWRSNSSIHSGLRQLMGVAPSSMAFLLRDSTTSKWTSGVPGCWIHAARMPSLLTAKSSSSSSVSAMRWDHRPVTLRAPLGTVACMRMSST